MTKCKHKAFLPLHPGPLVSARIIAYVLINNACLSTNTLIFSVHQPFI